MKKLSRREFLSAVIATAGVTSTSAAILTRWPSTPEAGAFQGRQADNYSRQSRSDG
ncbi:MAG TPA: hypothetical protein VIF81_02575 [Pyrinomonadaceae bacterium]